MEIIKITRGGKFDQSIIYVCMETSQWNPLVQLIYANKKGEKNWEPRAGSMAQLIQCSPSKCKALNSNPSPTKIRTKVAFKGSTGRIKAWQ
jgi:hypothetical protein